MQKVLYRDDPSIVLWYDVNLQAFRTDRWAGYVMAPSGDGAPFWNQLRSTYLVAASLEPRSPPLRPPGPGCGASSRARSRSPPSASP